jgi:small redox-active disulfide protein 2
MKIKVLGPGCMNCRTLERRTIEALENLGVDASVDKVVDIEGIASYGVMRTPGLVIDEKLVWQGGVPSIERIKELITSHVKVA